jgi:sporulation protein YlmC with PRC-barrel domain
MTTDGRDLGQIVDLYFDEQTGKVEGYEVSGGIFADAYSGRSFVPAYQTLTIGNDVAFVPPEVADMMEEQVGGIKAAAQSATESVSTAASTAGSSLSSATRSATAAVTNRIVDPAEQRTFAVGKVAQSDVETPDGLLIVAAGQTITEQAVASAEQHNLLDALYRAAGGSVTSNLRESVSSTVNSAAASRTVEQARGRRVQQAVRNDDGLIIAAPGQIVTEQVIERARMYNREAELMDAVGLTAGEAARSSAGGVATSATESLRSGATQVSATASGLLDRARERISELRDSAAQEAEERRINNALGRPVNRVILDQQDNVILNVGELITHKAVQESRAAGVLEVLLSSVYDKEPELTTDDLRAPMEGDASLEHQQKTNL